jgi:aryl-alcohol dehydrogenase-like predicted oxidoreductase
MHYRRLGTTGLRVSAIGLGTNAFGGRADASRTEAVLVAAVEAGVTLIDTANVYTGGQSETLIGQVLRGALKGRRDDLILASKAAMPTGPGPNERGATRYHLLREVEKSLTRLGTDYLDLFWVHTWDPETPLEETLSTLDALVRAGKVRYVGCSNYRAWETMKALGVSAEHHWVRYQAVQLSYSLADRVVEREVFPLLRNQGLGLVSYFPLAGGILTGKYQGGHVPEGSRADAAPAFRQQLKEEYLTLADGVTRLAREAGVSPSQLALAWVLDHPEVSSAIAGATRPEQVQDNVAAADVVLTADVRAELDRLSERFRWSPPFGEYRPLDPTP